MSPANYLIAAALCALLSVSLSAKPSSGRQQGPAAEPAQSAPTFHVNAVARNVKAVNYRHRGGSTEIDFRGTELMPQATGHAKVDSKTGRTVVDAKFKDLQPANSFGLEYLTYVLWAITPEGRVSNLGQAALRNGEGELHVTTDLQAFGLILTAEPYFSVTQPSDVVVLENVVRPSTKGEEEPINARYELLPRGLYHAANQPITDMVYGIDKKAPSELMQARNAVRIARNAQAGVYAAPSFHKAEQLLARAEDYYLRRQSKSAIASEARAAAQTAEEARVMSLKREQEAEAEAQRQAAAEHEAQAKAEAEAEAQRRAQAEAERRSAEQAKAEAERAQQQSEIAARQAQQEREQAEQARAAALAQQLAAQTEAERARLTAQQAEQARLKAEQDKEELRARLLQQLNQVLQTRDTARGLIVNMSDVLFDTGKATLKPGARERLAKVAGIILAYPDLRLQIGGHTDSIGSDAYNQRLSEQRADTVSAYLVAQGVSPHTVTAEGFGKSQPIASNATPAGRQLNRRVELVVSGEAIGRVMGPGVPQPAVGGTAGAATAAPRSTQPPSTPPGSIGAPAGTPPPPPQRVNPPPPREQH